MNGSDFFMDIVPYAHIPQAADELSYTGVSRAGLIEREHHAGIIIFPVRISVGDRLGVLYPGKSAYTVTKIRRPKSIDSISLHRMNKGGYFVVVLQTKMNTLRVIEMSLTL